MGNTGPIDGSGSMEPATDVYPKSDNYNPLPYYLELFESPPTDTDLRAHRAASRSSTVRRATRPTRASCTLSRRGSTWNRA
ncbi:MAG: hypothetical protein ACLSVD_02230 [Eggerthellaceae bacterium]